LSFEGFSLRNGVAAIPVDGGEVAEHRCGVHLPRPQFLFYEGKIRPDISKV
jgi:hypothetical protein